jgi:HD-GYP domain-containing protein (c-di-GMP phosphodiesterase class II)
MGRRPALFARAILVVADIFDALSAARPYRDALPLEKVFAIMKKMRRARWTLGVSKRLNSPRKMWVHH